MLVAIRERPSTHRSLVKARAYTIIRDASHIHVDSPHHGLY